MISGTQHSTQPLLIGASHGEVRCLLFKAPALPPLEAVIDIVIPMRGSISRCSLSVIELSSVGEGDKNWEDEKKKKRAAVLYLPYWCTKGPVADCSTRADQPSCILFHGRKERKMDSFVFRAPPLISYVDVSQTNGWRIHKSAVFRLEAFAWFASVTRVSQELALCARHGNSCAFFFFFFFSCGIIPPPRVSWFFSPPALGFTCWWWGNMAACSWAMHFNEALVRSRSPAHSISLTGSAPVLSGSGGAKLNFLSNSGASFLSRQQTGDTPSRVRDSHYWPPLHSVLLKKNHVENPSYQ